MKNKKFGYQILEQTVQTQKGMTIVREYSKTKDAQSVHAKLIERHELSQAATLAQDALERELGDLRHRKGQEAWGKPILHWVHHPTVHRVPCLGSPG
jgi:hypothetical protein